jgi:NADH:ubiquinone oxidoreductase subunit D
MASAAPWTARRSHRHLTDISLGNHLKRGILALETHSVLIKTTTIIIYFRADFLHEFMFRNECNNVFNAACGVRCNSGYELTGDSIRNRPDNNPICYYIPIKSNEKYSIKVHDYF